MNPERLEAPDWGDTVDVKEDEVISIEHKMVVSDLLTSLLSLFRSCAGAGFLGLWSDSPDGKSRPLVLLILDAVSRP